LAHSVAAAAVNMTTKTKEVVQFQHAALFSPSIKTLAEALRREYIIGFPGLTKETLYQHPPNSKAMIKGHLDQNKARNKSNNKTQQEQRLHSDPNTDDEELHNYPEPEKPYSRSHYCYSSTIQITGQVFTDQTGRFPTQSSNGYNYIFCLYDYDSNYIDAVPIRNRSAESILEAYKLSFNKLKQAGLTPRLARLDNECSNILKQFLTEEEVTYQLVPPHIHRRNAAERAIRTFKNHFIAGLATCDTNFPMHLWDRLIPQALLTLNMLRGSRLNSKLSAHAQVMGQYHYTNHPLAPPGTQVMVHEKPSNRKSWAPHATEGWYVGPAMEHYRCYMVWMKDTRHL
jgi:hypothetical protein